MACSIDHSKLIGLKFCTECGAAVVPAKRLCAQGHELVRSNKFCEVCGGPEVSGASPTPANTTSYAPPPPPPQGTASTSGSNFSYQPTVPEYTPAKKSPKILIGVIAAVLIIAGGVLINANRVKYTDVTVTMNIYGQNCYDLSWGYYDIPSGEVVLTVDGKTTAYASYPSVGIEGGSYCSFITTFSHVPMNGDYYTVAMSSGRRGTVTNSRSDMESNGWDFGLSLGL
jgi:hypothetical protein